MTFDELISKVLDIFPDAFVGQEYDGEIVIATRMTETADGKIVPMKEEEL
jgi:hypothetical protein